ncbi:unnamed protein product [Heterobilharzia americana]|nr:unnamed protein product [Heterobilharzia americana]CAH8657072.1 unnamed protein product [Heterobilharzia americana]
MCEVQPQQTDIALVLACHDGNFDEVKRLVEEKNADICYQDFKTGMSVLMVASGAGHTDIVKYLLSEGAPWNAVDRNYLCAGDYAAKNGQQECIDVLMSHAVMSELLLSMAMGKSDPEVVQNVDSMSFTTTVNTSMDGKSELLNASYLTSRLEYSNDGKCLIDTNTHLAVMMDWETPIMEKHAAWICQTDVADRPPPRVLNVGFGMGIVDNAIQKYSPDSHVIIEAHPEVLQKMKSEGWFLRPGVRIISSRWQDAVVLLTKEIDEKKLPRFDGIFFDTYAEDDNDLREFHTWLPKLLSLPNHQDPEGTKSLCFPGRYSYYNGLCPDNVFFHGVACETMRLHLNRLGISCVFDPIAVDVADQEIWKDVSKRYWYFDTYFLPKCTFDLKE